MASRHAAPPNQMRSSESPNQARKGIPNLPKIRVRPCGECSNYSGISDFYRMYLQTLRIQSSFNLAYIGDDFHAPHKEDFDQTYMRALYHYAYEKAVRG